MLAQKAYAVTGYYTYNEKIGQVRKYKNSFRDNTGRQNLTGIMSHGSANTDTCHAEIFGVSSENQSHDKYTQNRP